MSAMTPIFEYGQEQEQGLIITPTERMQRQFMSSYAKEQLASGRTVWAAPAVSSLQSWINETWLFLQDNACPLASGKSLATFHQRLALWRAAISRNPLTDTITTTTSVAIEAASAHKTLKRWREKVDSSVWTGTPELEQFEAWQNDYVLAMNSHGLVDEEDVVGVIVEALNQHYLSPPPQMTLYAFDEIPPLTQMLFDAMLDNGTVLTFSDPVLEANDVKRVPIRQRADQFTAAAQWAQNELEQNPQAKIAIICPELKDQRSEISEAFGKVFEPQFILPSEGRYTLPFNFSAGTPLSDVPIVKDALSFLSLNTKSSELSVISSLLRSPYVAGYEEEFDNRAQFLQRLQSRRSHKVSISSVVTIQGAPEILTSAIGQFLLHMRNKALAQKPSQWASFLSVALEHIGWPGDRQLDSEEYQALMHWQGVLDKLSQLDIVCPECNYDTATSMLQQILVSEVFQPQTHESPIQILGLLEASGLSFDAAWVIDLNDDIWPATPTPSPFIPIHMQKHLDMPHSCPDRELSFAKTMVDRLSKSAPKVIFSYANLEEDRELRCSSIIQDVIEVEFGDLLTGYEAKPEYSTVMFGSVEMSPIVEGDLTVKDTNALRGGTGILTAQHNCPFQAFAKYRLGATESPEGVQGLSPAERGEVVHLIMQHIWSTLSSQQELVVLSDDQKTELIDSAIDSAFFWLRGRRDDIGDRFIAIERDRLMSLTSDWLDLEASRQAFEVVSVEKLVETEVAGLPLRLKLDRIDEVNGKRFYIDYKTGSSSLGGWDPEKLAAPQLPSYATSSDDESVGAAIGQVRKGDMRFKGIADDTAVAPGITTPAKARANLPESWAETKSKWKESLEKVASEFIAGVADVKPANRSVCSNCHLSTLCRKQH